VTDKKTASSTLFSRYYISLLAISEQDRKLFTFSKAANASVALASLLWDRFTGFKAFDLINLLEM
jgi:hypothetical protein